MTELKNLANHVFWDISCVVFRIHKEHKLKYLCFYCRAKIFGESYWDRTLQKLQQEHCLRDPEGGKTAPPELYYGVIPCRSVHLIRNVDRPQENVHDRQIQLKKSKKSLTVCRRHMLLRDICLTQILLLS